MEKLFGTQLNGIFKDAHEFASKELGLSQEDAEAMGEVTKGIQLIVELSTLPLQMELDKAKKETEAVKEELAYQVKINHEMDNIIGEKMQEIRKLEVENRNLLSSLKYLKEVSEKQDLVNDNVVYLSTHIRK